MTLRTIPILAALAIVLLVLGWWSFDTPDPAPAPDAPPSDTEPGPAAPPAVVPPRRVGSAASRSGTLAPESPPSPEAESPDGTLIVGGTLYRQDGVTPVSGVRIVAEQGEIRRNTRSAEGGRFRMKEFAPGDVYLGVQQTPDGAGGRVGRIVAAGDRHVRLVLAARGRPPRAVRPSGGGKVALGSALLGSGGRRGGRR